MTQGSGAQGRRAQLAWKSRASRRTLAQRRADFAAQMRAMALSDLEEVSRRLKALHGELEKKDGRKWTQLDLATAMNIAYRTFQSWENGEVENSDGEGYDKMARFYSRRLGRKITRSWILFGDEGPKAQPASAPTEEADVAELRQAVAALRTELRSTRTKLLSEIGKVREAQAVQQQSEELPAREEEASGT